MNRWLVILCILLQVPAALSQPREAPEAGRQFRVAAIDEAVLVPLRYGNGENEWIAQVPWMHRGGPYALGNSTQVTFVDANAPKDAPPIFLATAEIPANVREPLLLFSRNPGGASPLRVVVVEDDAKEFPYGSYRFLNATDEMIRGTVGGVPLQLAPGEEAGMKPSVPERGEVVVVLKAGGRPFAETIWTYESRLRKFVIFLPSPDGSPQLTSFNEWRRPADSQP